MGLNVVADIGGTNARFALAQAGEVSRIATLPVNAFGGVVAAMRHYLDSENISGRVASVCMAVAGPVRGRTATLTNAPWAFDCDAIQRELDADHVELLNDWEAVAWSLAGEGAGSLSHWTGDAPDGSRRGAQVLIGPGTGLGVAHLFPADEGWRVVSGEGGHVTWSPRGARQLRIAECMYERLDHVSFERVASGQGLVNLYEAICQLDGCVRRDLDPASIVRLGLSNEDASCREALTVFHHALGALAGNLALVCSATRVCLAGGVVQRLGEDFMFQEFWRGFTEKGRLSHLLEKTPVARMTSAQPGLEGCGVWLAQSLAAV